MEKPQASGVLGDIPSVWPHPFPAFTPITFPSVAPWASCLPQPTLASHTKAPVSLPWFLVARRAGQWSNTRRKTGVYQDLPKVFYNTPSATRAHTDTFPHQHLPLKVLPWDFHVSFSLPPHPQRLENQRSRSTRLPDAPALFTPPKSFKMTQKKKKKCSQTPRVLPH